MSKADAKDLSDRLNEVAIKWMWLISNLTREHRSQILQLWEEGSEKVLLSTFTDGFDNSTTKDVIINGATHSLYSLLQAIGRIRPKHQWYDRASVYIFHSRNYIRSDAQKLDDTLSQAIGSGLFSEPERHISKNTTRICFTVMDTTNGSIRNYVTERVCTNNSPSRHNHAITDPTVANKMS